MRDSNELEIPLLLLTVKRYVISPFVLTDSYFNFVEFTSRPTPSCVLINPSIGLPQDDQHKFKLAFGKGLRWQSKRTFGTCVLNNSFANIKGCYFYDSQEHTIIPQFIQNYPSPASGILAISSTLNIEGDATHKASYFNKSDLFTSASNVLINYTEFVNANITSGDNLDGQTVIVEHNKLTGTTENSQVAVQRCASADAEAVHTSISYNTFDITSDLDIPYSAIHLVGTLSPSDIANVSQNTISFNTNLEYWGIKYTVFGSENANIDYNNIKFAQESGAKGIGIYLLIGRTKGAKVSFNSIKSKGYDSSDNSLGILDFGVSGMDLNGEVVKKGLEFCSNLTDSLGYGFYFTGNCDRIHLVQNIIKEHKVGLTLGDIYGTPAVFGHQERDLNEWHGSAANGTYPGDAAQYLGNPSFVEKSVYHISDAAVSSLILNPSSISNNVYPPSGWFVHLNGENETCGLMPIPGLTGFDSLIVNSNTLIENLPEPVKFYLKKDMIGNILEDDDLVSAFDTYLTSMEDETEYKLANVEIEIKRAIPMLVSDQEDVDANLSNQKSTIGSIVTYDAYNYANVDTVTFTELTRLDSISAILGRSQAQKGASDALILDNRVRVISDLSDILDELNDVEPRAKFDASYKSIDSLYIKYLSRELLNANDYEIINKIAHDDEDSSFANITAFELFNPCSEDEFPFYAKTSLTPDVTDSNAPQSEVEKQALNYETKVSYNSTKILVHNNGSDKYFELFNLEGKSLYSIVLNNNLSVMDLNNELPSGLYYWRVSDLKDKSIKETGILPIIK